MRRIRIVVHACLVFLTAPMPALAVQVISSTPPTSTDKLDKDTETAQRRIARETVALVADGSVQAAVNGKGEAPAAGSIGIRHASIRKRLNALNVIQESAAERVAVFYSFASTLDTIESSAPAEFGSVLAASSPAGRKSSFSVDYHRTWAYAARLQQQFGLRAYGGVSRMTWTLVEDTTRSSGEVVPFFAGIRAMWIPINKRDASNGNSVGFAVEFGPTFRYVDFNGDNAALLRSRAANGETHFWGVELVTTLQVRDVVASLHLPIFNKSHRLDGLTNAGPRIALGIQTHIASFLDDGDKVQQRTRANGDAETKWERWHYIEN